ncbi:hypothetical protein FMUND_3840 [Fusarium mundagurra]|uniref:Uncharacterized protein n=1 Tax=Fusarium mundagurra TaxID=1567541 RepID=A0A8H6DMX8_9HYPO|nr:hypothetical protein FMUND_3840 [Fusarium mundagurra]
MTLDKTINKSDPAPDHDVSSTSDRAQRQDHPISSSAEASNSNAEPPKIPGQSISTSQAVQSKSNNPPITGDMGIQDSQSGVGRRPDRPIPESLRNEEPHSSYVNEEDYGKEEDYDQEQDYDSEQDYDQEQDHGKEQKPGKEKKHAKAQKNGKGQKHGKKQKPSHDSTASDHSSADSTGTDLATDRLVAIDFTVYRTEYHSRYPWCPARSFFSMSLAEIMEDVQFEKDGGVTISLECTVGEEDLVYRRKARTEERFRVLQQRLTRLIDTLKDETPPNKKGDPTFEIIIESLGPRRWTS